MRANSPDLPSRLTLPAGLLQTRVKGLPKCNLRRCHGTAAPAETPAVASVAKSSLTAELPMKANQPFIKSCSFDETGPFREQIAEKGRRGNE
jgi:hypothetical protein